ncbi:MAG: hypothetical protein AAGF56_11340 [Pseudomonadota bacterium]
MLRATVVAISAGLLCSACANDTLAPSSSLSAPPLSLITTGSTSNPATTVRPGGQSSQNVDLARDKTMAGKVLTAIALERVTGRKPDPATLSAVY